jgi:4-hydroxybenzoate polyprenyltransferase
MDALQGHWVDQWLPHRLKPYARLARLDRPIGWWLLLLPCWWSLALAGFSHGSPSQNLGYGALFLIGAVSMRGAGCTYNDLIDRDLDAQVTRTHRRPLPAGEVTPVQAALFILLQALIGLVVLLQLPRFAQGVGIASLALVAFYPFAKRIMSSPQVMIGLTFSWGALMGWATLTNTLGFPALLLYLGTVAWSVGYDTIYGLQDREDDISAGILSLTRTLGDFLVHGVAMLYTLSIFLLSGALYMADAGPLAYSGILLFSGHLLLQVYHLSLICASSQDKERQSKKVLALFRSNRLAGMLLLFGMCLPAMTNLISQVSHVLYEALG